jgi:hypothetical protein
LNGFPVAHNDLCTRKRRAATRDAASLRLGYGVIGILSPQESQRPDVNVRHDRLERKMVLGTYILDAAGRNKQMELPRYSIKYTTSSAAGRLGRPDDW